MTEANQVAMSGSPILRNVVVGLLPDVHTPKGSQSFSQLKQSIKSLGILVPVILHEEHTGNQPGLRYRIISGRRRIAAAREIGLKQVPAIVYPKEVHEAFIPSATIAENAIRSDNVSADIESVRTLRDQGLTIATISEFTGMPTRDVTRLIELLALPDEIIAGVQNGSIAQTTANELRKSTPEVVASTLEVYRDKGKLTLADVKEARSTGYQTATATLDIPETPQLGPTLREQIIAILDDLTLDYAEVVREIEKVVRPNVETGA